jgi:dipeptidyl aminopeptidase/acylaminoacyl peptidase
MCPTAPVWLDDQTLLAAAEDRGSCHLYRLHVDGRPPEPLTTGPLTVHGFDAAAGVVATARSTVRHPADLWVAREGADERVTHVATDH